VSENATGNKKKIVASNVQLSLKEMLYESFKYLQYPYTVGYTMLKGWYLWIKKFYSSKQIIYRAIFR
jgi:hypothetical protein